MLAAIAVVRIEKENWNNERIQYYSYEAFRKKYQDDIRIVPRATFAVLDRELLGDYIERLKRKKVRLFGNSQKQAGDCRFSRDRHCILCYANIYYASNRKGTCRTHNSRETKKPESKICAKQSD